MNSHNEETLRRLRKAKKMDESGAAKIIDIEQCALCYSHLFVRPASPTMSCVSTCAINMHKKQHRVISNQPLNTLWNATEFRLQRRLAANKKTGTSCLLNRNCTQYMQSRLGQGLDFYGSSDEVIIAMNHKQEILTYLPKALTISSSNRCMNQCYHCLNNALEPSLSLIQEHREQLMNIFFPAAHYIEFTGGEPLLTSMDEITYLFKKYPHKKYRISTNGVLLDSINIQNIPDAVTFVVTMYGFNDENYRAITKTENFKRVYRGIQRLIDKGYGKHLFLKFIVYPESIDTLDEFCKFIVSHKALQGAAVVSDTYASKLIYKRMKKIQTTYMSKTDNIEWYYSGRNRFDMLTNMIDSIKHWVKWQQAIHACRKGVA